MISADPAPLEKREQISPVLDKSPGKDTLIGFDDQEPSNSFGDMMAAHEVKNYPQISWTDEIAELKALANPHEIEVGLVFSAEKLVEHIEKILACEKPDGPDEEMAKNWT